MCTRDGEPEAEGASEFAELDVGFDPDVQLPDFLRELFFGNAEESSTARLARVDAARGILADLQVEAPELAAYIATLRNVDPSVRRTSDRTGQGGGNGE